MTDRVVSHDPPRMVRAARPADVEIGLTTADDGSLAVLLLFAGAEVSVPPVALTLSAAGEVMRALRLTLDSAK
jgi:hypothetical protein